MTTPKKTKAQTQAEIDAEDASLREKARQQVIREMIDPYVALCQSKEAYKELTPEEIAFVFMLLEPKASRPTFEQMGERLTVDPRTLYRWQNNPVIIDLRFDMMKIILKRRTPDILANLADAAQTNVVLANPVPAATLFLKFIEEWKEVQKVETDHPPVFFGFNGASPFIQPDAEEKPRESAAQQHGKQVKAMLGKKSAKKPRSPKSA